MSVFKFDEQENEDIIYFDYHLSNGKIIKFGMCYVEEAVNRKFIRDSAPKKLNRKSLFKTDMLKYRRLVVDFALKDIKDATYEDMNCLTEPRWRVILPDGKKWTDIVPFDDDVKRYVVKGMHADLGEFLEEACMEFEAFKRKKHILEMKNLNDGSNTGQNMGQTDSN